MKRRLTFSLVVFGLSGICLAGCAAPQSPGGTEARLQNLENKVASYSELSARVAALEQAVRAKGIMEPALGTESLPPLPGQPEDAQRPHSDFVVSSVPGQKEVTSPPTATPPATAGGAAAGRSEPESKGPTPRTTPPAPAPTPLAPKQEATAPAPFAGKQETPPTATISPFTAKQSTPPQETATQAASGESQPQDAASPFSAKADKPLAKAGQPPLPQLDGPPKVETQAQPAPLRAQNKPETATQATAQQQIAPAPAPAPTPAPAPKPAPKTEKGAYESALALYESGKNAESRKAMAAFMQTYPGSIYAPNALYWIGESHYSQSQWDQAILSFKDVVARFPKHAKAADALLKLGMSYEQLKDKDNARFHYEALLEDFPASRAAGLARQKLAKL